MPILCSQVYTISTMKNISTLYAIIAFLVGVLVTIMYYGVTTNHYSKKGYGMRSSYGEGMGSRHDMHATMDGMMGSLKGKTGDTFDKAFLSEMIVHHEGAVAMAEQVLATSKRPELLKLANDIISAQNKEIEMMKTWGKTWFGQ